MKSKVIALSAIGAAFIAIFLTLGAYIEVIDICTVLIASVFVLLPLYLHSYKACFLTYLAGTILAFMFSGFNIYSVVFPLFLAFFGLYPIIKCLVFEKKINKYVFYVLGLIWAVGATFGTYFYYIGIMGKNVLEGLPTFIVNNIYYVIAVVGILFYILFDRFVFVVRIILNRYLQKVVK